MTAPPPSASTDLQTIPGVGPSITKDLHDLGIRQVQDLRCADPERLYERLCIQHGAMIDRCVLYVFRCAVYFASHEEHDPNLLKWWNWKDEAGSTPIARGRISLL
jgi:hypothetical protein